jgi:hypothetical protein
MSSNTDTCDAHPTSHITTSEIQATTGITTSESSLKDVSSSQLEISAESDSKDDASHTVKESTVNQQLDVNTADHTLSASSTQSLVTTPVDQTLTVTSVQEPPTSRDTSVDTHASTSVSRASSPTRTSIAAVSVSSINQEEQSRRRRVGNEASRCTLNIHQHHM